MILACRSEAKTAPVVEEIVQQTGNTQVEFIELEDHPFWIGTQAHPELTSRPTRPAPLFRALIGAAVARARSRAPGADQS